jgi:CIC family chloride channel protein
MQNQASPKVVDEENLNSLRKYHLFLVSLVGLGVGGVAVAFAWLSRFISGLQNDISGVFTAPGARLAFLVVFCSLVGGIVGALTERVAPEAGGSGIPHVKAVLAHLRSLRGIPVMVVKFLG